MTRQKIENITDTYTLLHARWYSVENRPLFKKDVNGGWVCTEDGEKEFIAAVRYEHKQKTNEDFWWIRHCVIEDEIGLCVVGDITNEPAGWDLEDVMYWMPMPCSPNYE